MPTVELSPDQLQQLLTKAVAAGVAEATKMNPLEEKRYLEELEREERRNKLAVELGKAEEEALRKKRDACTHSRDKEGNAVSRGSGIWTTQGQVHGNERITLLCMRCATTWTWKATADEREAVSNSAHGLMGWAPPAEDRLIREIA